MLAPALAVLAAVAGWPLLRTLWVSVTDAELGAGGHFVGLANYAVLAADPEWWRALRNTAVFTVVSVALELVLGLLVALVLDQRFHGRGALRAAVLVPWAIPTVVAAQMWRWMYNDLYGVVNDLALRLGLIGEPVAWLVGEGTAMAAVIVADAWKATPFVALVLLAGLQTIPGELYEAARVDGAGRLGRFFHVTLPLLRPAIAVAVVFRTLDALRVFDVIYVMLGNAQATATVSIYARQQLVAFQDAGLGSAASVAVFVLVGMVSVGCIAALRPGFAGGGR